MMNYKGCQARVVYIKFRFKVSLMNGMLLHPSPNIPIILCHIPIAYNRKQDIVFIDINISCYPVILHYSWLSSSSRYCPSVSLLICIIQYHVPSYFLDPNPTASLLSSIEQVVIVYVTVIGHRVES